LSAKADGYYIGRERQDFRGGFIILARDFQAFRNDSGADLGRFNTYLQPE
jgi:hypothetical protein